MIHTNSTHHPDGTEPITISINIKVDLQNKYPNAIDAGSPSAGRLIIDRFRAKMAVKKKAISVNGIQRLQQIYCCVPDISNENPTMNCESFDTLGR